MLERDILVVREIAASRSYLFVCVCVCVIHARARTITGENQQSRDRCELFAVGELLGPASEFPVVYIESNRGSSHVLVREKRGVLLIHTWTQRGEKREKI